MYHASRADGLRLQRLKSNTFKVTFRIGDRRCRFADGRPIGLPLRPNRLPIRYREEAATELLLAFKQALDRGWRPDQDVRPVTLQELLSSYSPAADHSEKYRRAMMTTRDGFQAHLQRKEKLSMDLHQLTSSEVQDYLSGFLTPSTFNHERKRLSAILRPAYADAGLPNPITQIPKRREKATLHKPIRDVAAVLEDIKAFNSNLHICCLLTYGCMLRPHQEIRQLTWGDFDEGMTRISLSGSRNKSGRNRIVPIPQYVAMHLPPWGSTPPPSQNIFSRLKKPFNADYFKSLWTRYKAQSDLISPDQTLYSFRHTGAISVYEKTGNLRTVQTVMGHASMAV
ncbi:MAG: site-specific integrase, partial [Flavobacteriales bacterium]|nr:site-specific integrase [Flavobacteriales bacterium]